MLRTITAISVSCLWCLSLRAEDAGVLNRDLPSWISLGAQMRLRSEGDHGAGFVEGANHDYLLQRYRFSMGIRPVHGLQLFGEVQDARVAGLEAPGGGIKDRLDIRQAWVGVGSEESLWDLRVGRQRMAFGSERVIGAAEWGNTARVFDAVRLALHHGPDRVDLFASSVVNVDVEHWDHHQQGNNLHGAYASIGSVIPGVKLEPYLLYRTNPNAGKYHSWTGGLRSAGKVRKNWGYEGELIKQNGSLSGRHLTAWAATAQLQRNFGSLHWQPTLMGEVNYATGDKSRTDNEVNTYDQLYPTNHGIYGIADQIGRRNTKNVRGGIWLHPEKWLTLKAEGHSFWLASRHDGLYAFNGVMTVAAPAAGAVSADVGRELDLLSEVKLSRHYDIGLQFGHLFAGDFLKAYTPGGGRSFYAVYLDLRL